MRSSSSALVVQPFDVQLSVHVQAAASASETFHECSAESAEKRMNSWNIVTRAQHASKYATRDEWLKSLRRK